MSRYDGAVKTVYRSNDVEIPGDYLRTDAYDAKPITFTPVDFKNSVLPEYKGGYAVVLDNVLSPSECATLIRLAESSVMDEDKDPRDGSSWRPALVNVGGGYEMEIKDYRNSDRIIWDNQEIVDRLWARLVRVPEIRKSLGGAINDGDLLGAPPLPDLYRTWDFYRVNKRLRFLKYGEGQFFHPHCDGAYGEELDDGRLAQTWFTLHLYLNDSKQEVGGNDVDLVGGATSFLSRNEKRKMDIDPRAGRVLIFQHKRLYHCGDDVKAGIKYTVRTDLLYTNRPKQKKFV